MKLKRCFFSIAFTQLTHNNTNDGNAQEAQGGTIADLDVGVVDPLPVGGLELQRHVLLLGRDQLLVRRLHVLRRLLVLDRRQAPEMMKETRALIRKDSKVYMGEINPWVKGSVPSTRQQSFWDYRGKHNPWVEGSVPVLF